MLTLLVIFASITATLSSFPPVYNCSEGQSCNVECASTQFTTHCNNLTIIATKANNISISCEDNTYCDNMKIYCPKWNSSFSRYTIQCDIRCIGSNNVCNQLKVYSLPSITQLRCGGYISCTAATIYASNNAVNEGGKIYFHCDPNTTCDSISIQYDGFYNKSSYTSSNLWIRLYNQGIINNLTIGAANASELRFGDNDAVRIPGLYNNSVIDCSHCIISLGEFSSCAFTKILNTKFILTHSNDIDIEFGSYAYTQVFSFNEIYANYSDSIELRVYSEAVMTENKFYMQHASYVVLEVTIDGIFSNNTIFAENANNLDFLIYGKYYNNYLYGDKIESFMFSCDIPFHPACDARSNSFLLSNAGFVNLHSYDYSKFNVSAAGGLYNSIITAENASSFYVICEKCNMLTLVTSPNKTNVICDGFGCLNMTLYTKYTVDDVDVSITNCNCTYNVKSGCIDQWNIYCESNNYSEPSVVSSATICHGECCGDILNMLHDDSCPWPQSKSKFKINKYYFVIGGLAFVIFVQQILLVICCRKICAKRHSSNNFSRLKDSSINK